MTDATEVRPNPLPDCVSDGAAVLVGCLAGGLIGVTLGLLIAWTISPGWTLMSWIVLCHVTLAMVAMGAWCAPALLSDPESQGTMITPLVSSEDEVRTFDPLSGTDNQAQSLGSSETTTV